MSTGNVLDLPRYLAAGPKHDPPFSTSGAATGDDDNSMLAVYGYGDYARPTQDMIPRLAPQLFNLLENNWGDFVRETQRQVIGLAFKTMTWVSRALPLINKELMVVRKSRLYMSKPLPPSVPSLGTVRTASMTESQTVVATRPYGFGARAERIALKTTRGQIYFVYQLAQLSEIFRQSAMFDGLTKMWNPDPEEKAVRAQYPRARSAVEVEEIIRRDVSFFAFWQKERTGPAMSVQAAKLQMAENGATGTPDMLITDQEPVVLLQFNDTEYMKAGPAGPRRMYSEAPQVAFSMGIYIIPLYNPDQDFGYPVPSMGTNKRRIGDYTVFRNNYLNLPCGVYKTAIMNIKIYDESDMDEWAELMFYEFVKHCGRWDSHGMLNKVHFDLAREGKDDLHIYKSYNGTKRVARNFGCLAKENLTPEVIKKIAETICYGIECREREDMFAAIAKGMQLYETWHATVDGDPSFLHFLKIMDTNEVARNFVFAWSKFYSHVAACLCYRYNPYLNPDRCPHPFFAATPKQFRGPLVFFESTLGHDMGIRAPGSPDTETPTPQSTEAEEAPLQQGLTDPVAMPPVAVPGGSEGLFASRKAGVAGSYGFPEPEASGSLPVDESKAYELLYQAVTVEQLQLEGEKDNEMPRKLAAIEAVFVGLNGRPRSQWYFGRILHYISELEGASAKSNGASTLFSLLDRFDWNTADDGQLVALIEKQLRQFGNIPIPVYPTASTGNVMVWGNADRRRAGLVYYTSETNYLKKARWNENASVSFFHPKMQAPAGAGWGMFYHEREEPVDIKQYKPTHMQPGSVDVSDRDPEKREERHASHDSFPFAQPQFIERVEDSLRYESNDCHRAARIAFLGAAIRWQTLDCMMRNNVCTPYEALCVRLFRGYITKSVILMVGGEETGATYYGFMDVLVSTDGESARVHVRVQWRIATFINQPANLFHMAHVMTAGVLGGSGSKVMTNEDFGKFRDEYKWLPTDRWIASCWSILTAVGANNFTIPYLDIRGHMKEFGAHARTKHYPTAEYEMRNRGFNKSNTYHLSADDWRIVPHGGNSMAWQGVQFSNVHGVADWGQYISGKGHLGREGPGCLAVRQGRATMETVRFTL